MPRPVPPQMYDRAISAPTSPTRLGHSGKRSWEEPNWMGSPRLLSKDVKTGLSRSLQTLPTDSAAFDSGEWVAGHPCGTLGPWYFQNARASHWVSTCPLRGTCPAWAEPVWEELMCLSLLPWQIHSAHPGLSRWPGRAR